MENLKSTLLLSSEVMISEESKQHPVFLTVRFLLASSEPNKNHEGVTADFIHSLVSRREMFECLPMYVDMNKLLAGDYEHLGHLYSKVTKTFKTIQFGSLTNFYEEADENGVTYLYAEARFPKREYDACVRLIELYELGKLCVSVELKYNPEHTVMIDGAKMIDAHEDNALTGLCIVSRPAEEKAVALDMVAEEHADDSQSIITEGEELTNRGETETMKKENVMAEEVEQTAEAEQTVTETETTVAENIEQAAEPNAEETVVAENANAEEDAGEPKKPEEDDEDKKEDAVAETQETQAEVLEHSVDTHESVETCPYSGEPVHVIEYHERIIETMAEAGTVIAELESQIAELKEIESKYNAILAEQHEKVLAEQRSKAKAFAEKQGLDVTNEAVANAINDVNYQMIAELVMAEEQEEPAQEAETEKVTLASFVEMEVGNEPYGGILKPRKTNK